MPTIPLRKVVQLAPIYEAVWIDNLAVTQTTPLSAAQYAALAVKGASAPPGVPPAIWALGPSRAIAHAVPRYDSGQSLQPGDVVADQLKDGTVGIRIVLRAAPIGTFANAVFLSALKGDTIVVDGTGKPTSVTPSGGTWPAKAGVSSVSGGSVVVL